MRCWHICVMHWGESLEFAAQVDGSSHKAGYHMFPLFQQLLSDCLSVWQQQHCKKEKKEGLGGSECRFRSFSGVARLLICAFLWLSSCRFEIPPQSIVLKALIWLLKELIWQSCYQTDLSTNQYCIMCGCLFVSSRDSGVSFTTRSPQHRNKTLWGI